MTNTIVISGHPDIEKSNANKAILEVLEKECNIAINRLLPAYSDYNIDADKEIEKIRAADVVVLQFPFHWYGVPAILKMWLDSVTTPLVYGPLKGSMKGKTFILSTTTGGPEESYQPDGYNKHTMKKFLLPLLKLADSLEMHVAVPFVLHSAVARDGAGKELLLQKAKEQAEKLIAYIQHEDVAIEAQ
jgi:putative NADPH-quinone reductase